MTDPLSPHIPTADFLNHLFNGVPFGTWFELTFILPDGLTHVGPSPITRSYRLGHDQPDWAFVDDMNARGYGVYYGLTAKRKRTRTRSNENNAAWVSALWVDIDLDDGHYASKDDAYNAICGILHPATVIIDSGGGLHALWRIMPVEVTKRNRNSIKAILRNLAIRAHGDTAVAELARVFRLPGYINTKPKRSGAPCEIIDWLPGELTLDQFAEYAKEDRPAPVRRAFTMHKPDDLPAYIQAYIDTAHQEGTRNQSLNNAAFYMHSNGYSRKDADAMLTPRALADGLDERSISKTLDSAFRAAPGTPSYVDKSTLTRMRAGDVGKRDGQDG